MALSYISRYRLLQKLLNPYELSNKIILDIGCNEGDLVDFLNINNVSFSYIGIDINFISLLSAKNKNLTVVQCDLNNKALPFKDNSVDIVVCTEVLEHLINPKKIITEIHRIIKKDGIVIISLPNEYWWLNRLEVLFGYPIDKGGLIYNYEHLHYPNFKQIKEFIKYNDLEIIEERGWFIKEVEFVPIKVFLNLIPDKIANFFANKIPSLFARSWFIKFRFK